MIFIPVLYVNYSNYVKLLDFGDICAKVYV